MHISVTTVGFLYCETLRFMESVQLFIERIEKNGN